MKQISLVTGLVAKLASDELKEKFPNSEYVYFIKI